MDTHNENSPNTTTNNHHVNSTTSETSSTPLPVSSNQPNQDSGNNIVKLRATLGTTLKLVTNDPIKSVLCIFQTISLLTTVQGARIIFPKTASITLVGGAFQLIPWVLGSTVQIALILLLIFKTRNQSIVRRWFMILLLTLASIYSSFFCFYDGLLGGELTENSPKKIEAHNSLKAKVYTPLKNDYESLTEELKTVKKDLENEVNGERSGKRGFGPKAEELYEDIESKNKKLNKIKSIYENEDIKEAFTLSPEEIEKMTAKQVFSGDLNAWSLIPEEHKEGVSQPKFSNYENPEALLLPLKRLNDGEPNAIAALVIATFVDSSSLILGSIGDSFSLSKVFAIIVSGLIMSLKRLGATIRRTIYQESVPFETEVSQLSNSTQIMKLNNDIKGSEFLSELLNQIEKIDDKTYIIHVDKLFKIDPNNDSCTNKKPLFYKLLLTKMECSPFNWLEDYQENEATNFRGLGNLLGSNKTQNSSNSPSANPSQPNPPKSKKRRIKKSKKRRIKKECKDAFLNWLTSEIENQINQEQVESNTVAEISLYANPILRSSSSP